MKIRSVLSLALALLLCFSLFACGGDTESSSSSSIPDSSSSSGSGDPIAPPDGGGDTVEDDRKLESVGALPKDGNYAGENQPTLPEDESDAYPEVLPEKTVEPTVITLRAADLTAGSNRMLSDNATLRVESGKTNQISFTVNIPKTGIYSIDWSAVTGGAYIEYLYLVNTTDGAPLTTTAIGRVGVKNTVVADTSDTAYVGGTAESANIAQIYLAAGENTLELYFTSQNADPVGLRSLTLTLLSAATDGSLLVPAPSFIDHEANYNFDQNGASAPKKADKSGGPLLRIGNYVEYDITVTVDGEYTLLMLGAVESNTKLEISECSGRFVGFEAALKKTSIGGASTSSVLIELGTLTLSAGSYRIRVAVTSGWAHFTALDFVRDTAPSHEIGGYLYTDGKLSIALSTVNPVAGSYAVLKAYDENGNLVGYDYESIKGGVIYLQASMNDFSYVRVLAAADAAATDPDFMERYENGEYKVVFLSDTHLFDVDGLYGMTSIERLQMAVEQILWEHENSGKIDLLIMPGDVCNNALKESYNAGFLDKVTDKMGTKLVTVYQHTVTASGASGTDNDPLYLARLEVFKSLIKPLEDAGIEVYTVHGNHDIGSHRTWEAAFGYSQRDRYLAGCFEDKDGNLITDEGGKNYAIALNDKTAFMIVDCFDGENAGFISNASGKNWAQTQISQAVVDHLWNAVKDYEEVYLVIHTYVNHNQPALAKLIAENDNIVAVFDGHTHRETVTELACGKQVFTCGYVGIPMLNDQPTFNETPWSFRTLERSGTTGSISSYITLFGHEYPEYTYEGYSKCTTEAFTQIYTRRTPPTYIRKLGDY